MADELDQPEKQLLLQKTYIKDFSFESPKSPDIFTTSATAENLLNINSVSRELNPEHVEVTLTVNVKSVLQEDTAFQIEVEQAGVFMMKGYTAEERFTLLGSICPGMLYPYAREAIANVADKGGFPQLLVQPLDFNAMFAQNMQQRATQAEQA